MNEKLSQEQLDKAVAAIAVTHSKGIAGAGVVNFCETYKQVKPLMGGVLFLVAMLPNGKKIGDVIRFLMQLADIQCPEKVEHHPV